MSNLANKLAVPLASKLAVGITNGINDNYAAIVNDDGLLASYVTFTRSSTATRYNSAGLLELVAANQPRYDFDPATVTRANLLIHSEDFTQSIWQKTNVSITANALQAPDGTITADLITATGTANPNVYQNTAYLGSETDYTYTVHLRAGTVNNAAVQMFANGATPTGNITHSSISVLSGPGAVSGVGSTIINVTGLSATEWTRIRITGKGTATAGALACYIKPNPGSPTIGDSLYAWGAQLETGTAGNAYIRTGATPVGNATLRGLLIEEQRTNLAQHSAAFDNAAWLTGLFGNHVKPTVTANTSVAPDGTLSGDQLTSTHATASTIGSSISAATPSQVYAVSCWIRAGTATQATLGLAWGLAGVYVSENITTVNLTSQYQRFTFTATCPAAGVDQVQLTLSLGNRVSGGGIGTTLEVWGAQLETGAFATSYIPTTTASVTRAVDQASITGGSFSSIGFNPAQGTLFVETFGTPIGSVAFGLFESGVFNNAVYMQRSGSNLQWIAQTGGVTQAALSGASIASVPNKTAIGFALNDFAASVNNGSPTTDSLGTMPTGINTVWIGGNNAGANSWNGHIRRLRYYPRRINNTQLQALTA